MKGNTMNFTSSVFVPLVLGLVVAGIVYATLTGRQLPLISGPRAAVIAVLLVGIAMCLPGIGRVAASGRWLSPMGILGSLLGIVILVLVASVFTGWKLPLIAGETQVLTAMAVLIGVKFLIGTAGFFLRLL